MTLRAERETELPDVDATHRFPPPGLKPAGGCDVCRALSFMEKRPGHDGCGATDKQAP
jgi:hypothetical protein